MYPVGAAAIIILGVWLGILSYIFWRDRQSTRRLFSQGETGDIRERFSEVLEGFENLKRDNKILNKNLKTIFEDGAAHVQKTAVLRYNPYEDTGGNVSFSLAILDGKDSGIIITSLHTRAGTRVYVKEVVESKSELQLSKEEREVLEKAISSVTNGNK